MDSCRACGARLAPGLGWCGQCFTPVSAPAAPAPVSSPRRPGMPAPPAEPREEDRVALIDIPEEILELRSTVRDFVDREIRPAEERHLQEIQETGTFAGVKEERLEIRRRSAELGFWTLHMPEEVGGGGLSYL